MEQKGDFLGFKFAGVHSSDLNIVRTSNGDRFDEQIIPEVKDVTVEVPGMDGQYYFGTTYGPRNHEISFAFDKLTEEQFRRLRKVYGRKQIGELIFDERPYKKYLAKIESPIELSFVCFDEPNYTWEKVQTEYNTYVQGISGDYEHKVYDGTTRRIYKGEGKITFTCYFPFAKSVYKQLPVTEEESDWAVSSGIMTAAEYTNIDTYMTLDNSGQEAIKGFFVYNAGDVPTGFRLYLPSSAAGQRIVLSYGESNLILKPMEMKSSDIGVLVNTDSGLIVGVKNISINQDGNTTIITSGNLYNEYVESGYFFKLQPSISTSDISTLQIEGGGEGIQIFYDYLYF